MKILKRIGVGLLVFVLLVVVGPPLLYSVVPYDWPELPPAGKRIPVGEGRFVNAIDRGGKADENRNSGVNKSHHASVFSVFGS